ncbi:MAG: hypothetical protein ACYS80_25655 [Planctomycetota bacterium]
MRKDPVRFTSQWALIGVILFYTVGTAMIARHTKRIFTPASAGGSEHPVVEEHWQNNTTGLIHSDGEDSNLMLYDVIFGAEQSYEESKTSKEQNTEKVGDAEKKQQELTKIRTKLKCVEKILKNAVIEPYYVNGQIEGLQIFGLDKISEAKALFLKSGDIILAVNGKTLSSKKEAYDIFKKARKEPIMIVDLLQDGQAKKLLLDFQ